MATNPMQRKANNSFLLGMLITLLITGIIIGLLIMQVSKLNKEKAERDSRKKYVYVVTQDIKSGTEIQATQVQGTELAIATADSSVIYDAKTIDSKTKQEGPDTTGTKFPTGLKAKVDLHPGTVVTADVTYEEEELASDVRKQEYNIIALPTQLETGEYIDVRLRLPNGQDYVVVSHKQVTIPIINGVDSQNCIWINLSEVETLSLSSAIVEAYRMNGAKIYAARYVEPGLQKAAIPTYLPSDEVIALMNKDPNAVQEAKNALFARNNDSSYKSTVRNPINGAKNHEDAEDNLNSKVKEEIQGLQEEREKYLESLGG